MMIGRNSGNERVAIFHIMKSSTRSLCLSRIPIAAISGHGCSGKRTFIASGDAPARLGDDFDTALDRTTEFDITAIGREVRARNHFSDDVDVIQNIAQADEMRALDRASFPLDRSRRLHELLQQAEFLAERPLGQDLPAVVLARADEVIECPARSLGGAAVADCGARLDVDPLVDRA